MISYEQIQKVNEDMNGIDFKGKNYVMVNSRVTAFRKLFPEGFILTDIVSHDNGVVVMQCKAGYYEEDGTARILGSGLAFERQDSTYINKTSYIENCETSAVGRALGFLALGADDSICSAEELANAINNQGSKQQKKQETPLPPPESDSKPFTPPKQTGKVKMEKVDKAPEVQKTDAQKYVAEALKKMQIDFGIKDGNEMMKKFIEMRAGLINAQIIKDVKSDKQTLQEAEDMIQAMYDNFSPRRADK